MTIDSKATAIYHHFSKNEKDSGMKNFWNLMSEDEKVHVRYWQILSDLDLKGDMPQIVDNPQELVDELKSILPKLELYLEKSKGYISVDERFSIACNVELFMLHRSFVHLFYFMKSISHEEHPLDDYETHLMNFINKMNKVSKLSGLNTLITAIKRLWDDNKELVIKTNEDSLTMIFNRHGFFQIAIPLAYMAHRNKKNIAVMMIDIDKFKDINDRYGHQTGDEVLRFIGRNIKSYIRHSDIVGRYGGEEFLVFLSDIDQKNLYEIAEKVRREIEVDNKMSFPVTVSIGIADKVLEGNIEKEIDELIREADDNLYKAKRTGRNRVFGKSFDINLNL